MSDENAKLEIIGRKIFFLYPTQSIQNQIMTEMAQQEFEVYVSKNHTRLAQALKNYPNSIIYINVEEGMPLAEWREWISTQRTALPDIELGVFSSNNDEKFKDKIINDLHITCGFFILKMDMTHTTGKLLDILNTKNVKGRRKYLRANTERETAATINMPFRDEFIKGVIKDISVVGISCSFEHDLDLKKNVLFKGIQIRLQSMLLNLEAVVFGSRMDNNEKIYVMIFTQNISPEIRSKIRKYIQQNLQGKMDAEIN